MRFTLLAAAALSSVAVAQNLLDSIPKCAQTCFGSNLGTCGPLDIACICGNGGVINSVSCCVFATCSQAEIQATIGFATTLCKSAGVEVNTQPNCPSGSASASAAPSASGATNGTASATGTPSGTASAAVSGITGSASRTSAPAAASTAAAPGTGAGLGLGMVMAGLLAAL